MKLLLISSVIPQNTTATELVLFRHFTAAKGEIEVAIASDHPDLTPDATSIPIYPNPLLLRLTQTRFSAIAHSLRQLLPTHNTRALNEYLTHHCPDAILTVAHGTLYPLAIHISQQFQLPLITLFHDWFPDMARVPKFLGPLLNRQFLHLYKKSDLALCVSDGMRAALGEHPNAHVLPPIPGHDRSRVASSSGIRPRDTPFTVVYAGNLSDCYAAMLQQLGHKGKTRTAFQLRFLGPTPDWSLHVLQEFTDANLYGGFLSRDALTKELCNADVLLIVMSFNHSHRRRVETSFPSKMVEYTQFGKPIVIWGPEYSSAVKWAKQHQAAITVTSPDPEDLLSTFEETAKNTEQSEFYAQRALDLAQALLQPALIQQQFMDSLFRVVEKYRFSQ